MRLPLVTAILFITTVVRAEAPTTQPVKIIAETRTNPAIKLWVTQINLADPRVKVRVVPAGKDPDGDGPWQTTLMPVSRIADREKFDVAVNASFFSAKDTKDAEGKKSGYVTGIWSSAIGFTMTDGKLWSRDHENWPVLWIDSRGLAHITSADQATSATQMVAGNAWILQDAKDRVPTEGMMTKLHPRTAVGVNRQGTILTILTVDGRAAGVSVGMTGAELRDELLKHDVDDAINLDGGGSTTLVRREDSGELNVVNKPSDGRERAVADAIGVKID